MVKVFNVSGQSCVLLWSLLITSIHSIWKQVSRRVLGVVLQPSITWASSNRGKYPLAHPSAALVDAVTTLSSQPEERNTLECAQTLLPSDVAPVFLSNLCDMQVAMKSFGTR